MLSVRFIAFWGMQYPSVKIYFIEKERSGMLSPLRLITSVGRGLENIKSKKHTFVRRGEGGKDEVIGYWQAD